MKVKVRKLTKNINAPYVPPAVIAYFKNMPFKITYISRGKPVHKAERANEIRLRVHYNGIKITGKYYTFGKAENLWKYIGSTVNVVKNKVFDSNGVFLGEINKPNALFGRKVRCILKRLPETIVVDNGVEFVRMELIK